MKKSVFFVFLPLITNLKSYPSSNFSFFKSSVIINKYIESLFFLHKLGVNKYSLSFVTNL